MAHLHGIPNFHAARLSLIQSAIKHVLVHGGNSRAGLAHEHEAMQHAHKALSALEDDGSTRAAKGKVDECIRLVAEYAWAELTHDKRRKEQVEDAYKDSPCDVGWLEAVADYVVHYKLKGDKPLYILPSQASPPPVYDLPDGDLTVGLLGDWGTGEPVARVVVDQLFRFFQPDVVAHVGDVYYAGTEHEAEHNFLAPIREARAIHGAETPVYILPGNHDYYSGGKGFYDKLLPELNPSNPQSASFFVLHNHTWQLQGMDTGYYDHDLFKVADDVTRLHDEEAQWHLEHIDKGRQAGRKVILFSHHQYFSALLNIGPVSSGNQKGANFNPNLRRVFGRHIEAGDITGWFWGHEHLLEVYEPYLGLELGRCIGHSAFPVLDDKNAYTVHYPQVPLKTDLELGTSGGIYDHGFVVLRLAADGGGQVEYYTVAGDAVPSKDPDKKLCSHLLTEPLP